MSNFTYMGMRVLVLGLGISGRSAAAYLLASGADVAALDRNADALRSKPEVADLIAQGLHVGGESQAGDPGSWDLLVISPGVPGNHPVILDAKKAGVPVIGEVELACRAISSPMLGITGTNGKTTVSLLVGHILNASGHSCKVLGNSGIPLTSQVRDENSGVIVCELSSYQLETLRTPVLDSGVILNITADHLDRYKDMDEYARAKIGMGSCLKQGGRFYCGAEAFREFRSHFGNLEPRLIGFDRECDIFCDLDAIYIKETLELLLPSQYRGKSSHEVENIMAAYALCREMGVGPDDFLAALETFEKPAHRIEFVRSAKGVNFYNDSKGTNLDAVWRAVDFMSGKTVLIAGGQAKGVSFTPWLKTFRDKVKLICAIGEAAPLLEKELSRQIPVKCFQSLESAVRHAFSIAQVGENVLLSPGCASFDMFKNFEERGERFKEVVNTLDA